jgi:hypothetical protein
MVAVQRGYHIGELGTKIGAIRFELSFKSSYIRRDYYIGVPRLQWLSDSCRQGDDRPRDTGTNPRNRRAVPEDTPPSKEVLKLYSAAPESGEFSAFLGPGQVGLGL